MQASNVHVHLPLPLLHRLRQRMKRLKSLFGTEGKSTCMHLHRQANRIARGENGKSYDEDIIFERDVKERKPAHSHDDMEIVTRRRSVSAPRRKTVDEWDIDAEADYYNRKAMERAYIGEAHNGATKDWAIVDVPPGTNRVKMEGVGGGRQEVTWQRYNGVRRSKFLADDREYASDWGAPTPAPPPLPAPPKHKPADMWTEITKDLVIKEAIDVMGYDYEETDYFFYVMDYLRYVSCLISIAF